jgi:hypothetical protein
LIGASGAIAFHEMAAITIPFGALVRCQQQFADCAASALELRQQEWAPC